MKVDMRVYAILVVLALVASAQCMSACAIASCMESQEKHVPPCHQHGAPHGGVPLSSHHGSGSHDDSDSQSVPQHDKACDHQKTADEARWVAADLSFVDVVTETGSVEALASAGLVQEPGIFGSPPPLVIFSSVLRI